MGKVKGENGHFQFSPKSYFSSDVTADLCFFQCILSNLQTEAVKSLVKNGLHKFVTSSQTVFSTKELFSFKELFICSTKELFSQRIIYTIVERIVFIEQIIQGIMYIFIFNKQTLFKSAKFFIVMMSKEFLSNFASIAGQRWAD